MKHILTISLKSTLRGLGALLAALLLLLHSVSASAQGSSAVNFDVRGGLQTPSPQTIPYGGAVSKPNNPSRPSYAFVGWYSDTCSLNLWNFGSDAHPDAVTVPMTLYAKWKLITYKVAFNPQGGAPTPDTATVVHGSTVPKPANPAREGYSLSGWYTSEVGGSEWNFAVSKVMRDTTLYARWTANSCTVNFDVRGGLQTPTSQTVLYGGSVSKPNNPTRPSYSFEGWYSDTCSLNPWNFGSDAHPDAVTIPITLYAKWRLITCKVAFNAQGGAPTPDTATVVHGSTVSKPANPALEGYSLSGWYTSEVGGSEWNFAVSRVMRDTTLYARWTANSCAVNFDVRGGLQTPTSQTVLYGGSVSKPNNPTRPSYTFVGWYTDTCSLNPWNFGSDAHPDAVTVPMTLYAKWTIPSTYYLVTFNSQGGSAVPAQNVPFGEKATEPAPAPILNGYGLAGWYVDSTYSTEWSFNTPITGDTTLYAKWVLDSSEHQCEPKIKFTLSVPIRLSPPDTITYRWYRNGVLINGGAPDGIAVYDNSKVICIIPASEAKGINVVFYFDYKLNDGLNCWTLSPRKYTISFMPSP